VRHERVHSERELVPAAGVFREVLGVARVSGRSDDRISRNHHRLADVVRISRFCRHPDVR